MTEWLALIPARNAGADVGLVVRACLAAGAGRVLVVANGCTDDTAAASSEAGAAVMTAPAALGKGGAIRAGVAFLRHMGAPDAVVVVDADQPRLLVPAVNGLAALALEGTPGRALFNHPGRLGRRLPRLLDALDVDRPNYLDASCYLSPAASYPWRLLDQLTRDDLGPDGYGWDLWALLTLHAAGVEFGTVYAGTKDHRPGDAAHLTAMLHDNLDVAVSVSPPW